MKQNEDNRWAETDWDWIEPIEFDHSPVSGAIYWLFIGFAILGYIAAIWTNFS